MIWEKLLVLTVDVIVYIVCVKTAFDCCKDEICCDKESIVNRRDWVCWRSLKLYGSTGGGLSDDGGDGNVLKSKTISKSGSDAFSSDLLRHHLVKRTCLNFVIKPLFYNHAQNLMSMRIN